MTDRQENDRTRPELRWPGQPRCRYCGEPLDRLRAGLGWCGGTLCATRHRNEAERDVYRRSWNEYVDRVEQGVDDHGPEIVAAARTLGVAVEEMPIGIVPHLRRPLAPLPDARRAALLAHVRAVTAESFANGDPEPVPEQRLKTEPPEPDFMNAACIACRGHCCVLGAAKNAFLTARTIDHVRRQDPDLGPEAIVEHYAAMLPERSVEDSCAFHGRMGCTLSRNWRADMCNSFQCNGKRRTQARVQPSEQNRVLWIAAEKGGPETAVVIHDSAHGTRPVVVEEADRDPDRVAAAVATARKGLPERVAATPPASPPGPSCRLCGAPIDAARARTQPTCGSAACELAWAARSRS